MSVNMYGLYREETLKLSGTLVIGHRMVGEVINDTLAEDGYPVNQYDRYSWRYYLNLSGEYHAADYDYIRSVNLRLYPSADDSIIDYLLITIAGLSGPYQVPLTKDLVFGPTGNPAIATEYSYGSRSYESLVNSYPDAENLIKGIFYPVDIDVAVRAGDGSILYCGGYVRKFVDSNPDAAYFTLSDQRPDTFNPLIEENEVELLSVAEEWIKNIFSRWFIEDYSTANIFYLPLMLAMIYAFFPGKLMEIRLGFVRTSKVHSYHLREFLESNGRLGNLVLGVPKSELLYIYRNYPELVTRKETQDLFEELTKDFLNAVGLPVSGYESVHTTTRFENKRPDPDMIRVEFIDGKPHPREIGEVKDLMEKENGLAPNNTYDFLTKSADTDDAIASSDRDNMITKVVESKLIKVSDHASITLPELLVSCWIYCSATDRYGASIYIVDPINGESNAVTPSTALVLASYCYVNGFTDAVIDTVPTYRVRILPKVEFFTPSTKEPFPTTAYMLNRFGPRIKLDDVERVAGTSRMTYDYFSPSAFYDDVKKAYLELTRKERLSSAETTAADRSLYQFMASQYYWTNVDAPLPVSGQPYSDFILTTGVSLKGLPKEVYRSLFIDIVKKSTGNIEENDEATRAIMSAAMDVMRYFTGYSVQYVSEVITGNAVELGGRLPRTHMQDIGDVLRVYSPLARFTMGGEILDENSNLIYRLKNLDTRLDMNGASIGALQAPLTSPVTTATANRKIVAEYPSFGMSITVTETGS